MDASKYIALLKGEASSSLQLDYFQGHEDWPTFLNFAVTKGEKAWDVFINTFNYAYTAQCYIEEDRSDYALWLTKKDTSVDSGYICDIMEDISCFSKCPDLLVKYLVSKKSRKLTILYDSINHDNLAVFSRIMEEEGEHNRDVVNAEDLLSYSLRQKATLCVRYILDKMKSMKLQAPKLSIWGSLAKFGDFSLFLELQKVYENMFSKEFYNSYSCKPFFLSYGEVENKVASCGPHENMAILISRIPFEESCADLLMLHLNKHHYENNYVATAGIVSNVLSSRRCTEDTEKIIDALDKRGFSFCSDSGVDLSCVSVESWRAVLNRKDLFSFWFSFMEDDCFTREMHLPENRDLLKEVLVAVWPELSPKCLAKVFIFLGSGISQWGYSRGLLDKVQSTKFYADLAASVGNVTVLALIMFNAEKEGNPISFKDFNSEKVHPECLVLLKLYGDMTEDQKKAVFSEPYGEYFYDCSLVVNNKYFVKASRYNLSPDRKRR